MRKMHEPRHCLFIQTLNCRSSTESCAPKARKKAVFGAFRPKSIAGRPREPLRKCIDAWALPRYAGTAEAFLPARDDVPVVDIVRNATFESSQDRAGGPSHALAQLAALRIGGGV